MQCVLSVQAARADKAIEKRDMEGKNSLQNGRVNATRHWKWWEGTLILGQHLAGSKRCKTLEPKMGNFYLLYPKQTLQKGGPSLTPLCKA